MVSFDRGEEATTITRGREKQQQRNRLQPGIADESSTLEEPESSKAAMAEEELKMAAEELSKEREKSESLLRRLQYLQADFENYRRRVEREMDEVKKYGAERLLSELIVINDELELGLKKAREEANSPSLVEGFGMVLKRLQALLGREGVSRIVGVGEKFDPALHEAALRVPSDKEEGVIVEEIRSGYMLKGRVLRPSIVKVAEGGSREPQNGQYKTGKDTLEEASEQ